MSTDIRALNDQLKRQWCEEFSVEQLADGSLTVGTPFLFGDGDGYPVVIERGHPGWRLSDRGVTKSNLQFADLELTPGRQQQIARFASEQRCTYDAGVLTMNLEQPPTVEDIANFIELVARITGLPSHVAAERESERFGTRARDEVLSWLPEGEVERWATRNWFPAIEPRGTYYPSDLLLRPPSGRPVVAFFAGSTAKAEKSLLYVSQYQRWGLDLRPVLAHNGNLTGDTIFRAQTTIEDDSAVVKVNEAATETGYLPLRRKLAELGVPVG